MSDSAARVSWAREKAGFESAADFIRASGRSGSTYYGYENGSRPLPLKAARELASIFKVRAEWLFEGDGGPAVAPRAPKGSLMIPRISWVSAGRLVAGDPIANVDLEDYVEVAALPKGNWVALTVKGNSMDRIAPDGSTILVDRSDVEAKSERMYVFQGYDEHEATFKRYREGRPPKLQPFSTDPDEETLPLSPGMTVFGRVRRVIIDL